MNSNPKLDAFIKENLLLNKVEERPWGSYNLALSFDGGKTWAASGRTFGWGFSLEQAAAILLSEMSENPNHVAQLITILGPDKWNKLQDVLSSGEVDENAPKVETPDEIKQLNDNFNTQE